MRAVLIALALAPLPAAAQGFQYETRWYVGLRENVLSLQERQRERVEALRERRRAEEAAPPAAAATAAPAPAPVAIAQAPAQR